MPKLRTEWFDPAHHKWNLTPLLKNDHDPAVKREERRIERATKKFAARWRPRTKELVKPAVLREALDDYERWSRTSADGGRASFYFSLRSEQEENNTALKAQHAQVIDFANRMENLIRFFPLTLARIPIAAQSKLLGAPELSRYRHYLERAFAESPHLLTEEGEQILALKSKPAYYDWVRMTSGFISKEMRATLGEDGRRKERPFAEIIALIDNPQKKIRDEAARVLNALLLAHRDAAEAELNAILANKKTDDELRRFSRPDAARHLADDIDSQVVDSLVQAVSQNFHLSAKFYRLKAKLLKLPKLEYHERNVPIGKVDASVSFTAGVKITDRVLTRLDPEFGEIFRQTLAEGRVDALPRRGKHNGAFCADHLITEPIYVLLNHTGKMRDVSTIAHEMGHAINATLIHRSQNALQAGVALSTAEVASTFMEDFILEDLLQKVDEEKRLALLMLRLNDEISTIFRQIACYRFETELHQKFRAKGYLSHKEIGKIFQKHMQSYMGPAVRQSAGAENWWIYWSHIRNFFYVYSYANGLLISKYLQRRVRENPAFITEVKKFLSAGLSASPREIFRRLGADIAEPKFWLTGLAEVESNLKEATRLARKLKKI